MKVLAVIPARMGSARLPWKNRLEIEPGLSLAQHAVECARGSGLCDHVVVSTDAPEDLPIRNAYVSRRPVELSTGTADIAAVVAHELARACRECRTDFGVVVTLQPAVLARSPIIVRRLLEQVLADKADGGLTMVRTHRWIWEERPTGLWADWMPGPYPRSQDSAPRLQEINAVQVARAHDVAAGRRWSGPLAIAELPAWAAALDVDTARDLSEARDLWPFARRALEVWDGPCRTLPVSPES